jgi:hypothetical protein
MTFPRVHLPLLLCAFLAGSNVSAQRSPGRESSITITRSSSQCAAEAWCLTVEVRGLEVLVPSSTRVLSGALVSVPDCGSKAADTTGTVALSCSRSGTAELLVRQIGFLPARASVSAVSGASYLATVTLAPASEDPIIDTFSFPCEEWDAAEDRIRCFEALLDDVRGRLAAELDSTRALVLDPALLDSAQVVWEQFVGLHCKLQASLAEDDLPPVEELSCRHWFTEGRIRDIRELRWRVQWREPSNQGLLQSGPRKAFLSLAWRVRR